MNNISNINFIYAIISVILKMCGSVQEKECRTDITIQAVKQCRTA